MESQTCAVGVKSPANVLESVSASVDPAGFFLRNIPSDYGDARGSFL
jgi:hypothetical protein